MQFGTEELAIRTPAGPARTCTLAVAPMVDGAEDVLRRVNGERLVVLGWPRAIAMQLAHPLVAGGVLQHSAFRGAPWQAAARLRRTVGAMLALSFGPEAQRAQAVSRIKAIHQRVHGTLASGVGSFPAGTPYAAGDPALLLWVHATLLDSSAEVYQRIVGPLETSQLDVLCQSALPLLEELGGDATTAPRSWTALRTYIADVQRSGILAVSRDGRALADVVLSPRAGGLPLPLTQLQRRLTLGLLPSSIRTLYGWDWNSAEQRRFERTVRLIRVAHRVAPVCLTRWAGAR